MSLWRKKGASTEFRRSTSRVGLCWEPDGISIFAVSDPHAEHPSFERKTYKFDSYQPKILEFAASELSELGLQGATTVGILPFSEYQTHLVDVPNVPASEMREAIQWKVKDLLSLPLEEYVVDLIPLSFSFSAMGSYGAPSAYAISAKKTSVKALADIAHQIGLKLKAIDVADMSVCYLAKALQRTDDKPLAIIVLSENEQKILIVREGVLLMARSFAGLASLPVREGRADWMPVDFSMLINELGRSLDYFEGQVKQERPSSMVFLADVVLDEALFETIQADFDVRAFQLPITALFREMRDQPKHAMMHLNEWFALGAVYRGHV